MKKIINIILTILVCLSFSVICHSEEVLVAQSDYVDMSITDLMSLEVTSVQKRPESVLTTPSSVFVITHEDIIRSGYTTLPDVLRLAPGVEVARVGVYWAITMRGINTAFSSKVLVMIDGRSIYYPNQGGVYWHLNSVNLDDIERIEVIKGPSSVIWGSNALNGAINIITKKPGEDAGIQFHVAYGKDKDSDNHYNFRASYPISDELFFRANVFKVDFNKVDYGLSNENANNIGANLDLLWKPDTKNSYYFMAKTTRSSWSEDTDIIYHMGNNAYAIDASEAEPYFSDSSLFFKWERENSETSKYQLNVTYNTLDIDRDSTPQNIPIGTVSSSDDLDQISLELLHQQTLFNKHQLVYGFFYNQYQMRTDNSPYSQEISFAHSSLYNYGGFAEDTITIMVDRLYAMLGLRFENNEYREDLWLPSAKLLYRASDETSIWGSVSKGARNASIIEDNMNYGYWLPGNYAYPGAPPIHVISVTEDTDVKAEKSLSYEFGIKHIFSDIISTETSVFYTQYENLITYDQVGLEFAPDVITQTFGYGNDMKGIGYGGEFLLNIDPLDQLRLQFSYSYLYLDFELENGSTDTNVLGYEDRSPSHQLRFRSLFNITEQIQLDTFVHYRSKIEEYDIDPYTDLTVRVSYRPTDWVMLEIVGQDLLEDKHNELTYDTAVLPYPVEIQRSVIAKITLDF